MANTIQTKRKTTSGAPDPSDLLVGEMCWVDPDNSIFIKKIDGSVAQINSSSVSLSNTVEFSDDNYIYFVSDVSAGGWIVNRYENNTTRTKAIGTVARPNSLVAVQALSYS